MTPAPLPSIAVAIPTYLREAVLVATLEQVLAQSPAPDQILVVDQTPEHEAATESYLQTMSACGRITWLRQDEPNLPRARNRALRETRCDVVIFIDDDVLLPAGFVAAHRANYSDARIAAVAGQVTLSRPRSFLIPTKPWPRVLDYKYFPLDDDARVEGIARMGGCNHSVRRVAICGVGGYDETYIGWAYGEDSDAATRLWKAGQLVVFDPTATLHHLESPAGGCRVSIPCRPRPEWMLSFPAIYFGARHLFPQRHFWADVALFRFRQFVLRRAVVTRPWRLPLAVAAYSMAVVRALRANPSLPFASDADMPTPNPEMNGSAALSKRVDDP